MHISLFIWEIYHWICNSYNMACPPVHGDNPGALASLAGQT